MLFRSQCASEVYLREIPSLTSISSPPAASGPTSGPQSIGEPPASTLPPAPVPVKHQRPFVSGPKGSTVWYTTASTKALSSPPASLPVTAGILYIHTDVTRGTNQVWLCNINCKWTDVTIMENVKHPSITDRILLLRSDGIPSWLTGANYAAIQSRKERSG